MQIRASILTCALAMALALAPGAASAADTYVKPTDDLATVIMSAIAGDTVFLKKGIHDVATTITIPSGVTIKADPKAPPRSVVVRGGSNSDRVTLFATSGSSNVAIEGIRFIPAADAELGGRAVWFAFGGGDLTFRNNIVDGFTDALFAQNLSGGSLEFNGNDLKIVDRDPDSNGGFLGGNAGLTVLFSELDRLEANGNNIRGPGRNVERFVALTGVIVFNAGQTIGSIEVWNNAIRGTDFAIFSSGLVGVDGAQIGLNRLHSNGAGIAVGQVPDPDITIPTPADSTAILANRITGNDFGIIIAPNAVATTIEGNQITGNRVSQISDFAAAGETTIGANLIRGKNAGGKPDLPPGMAFDPVTGPVGGS